MLKSLFIIKTFIGTITQVPPMYSAIKVDGRPLYKYARSGKVVEVPKRQVEIFYIKLLEKTESILNKDFIKSSNYFYPINTYILKVSNDGLE